MHKNFMSQKMCEGVTKGIKSFVDKIILGNADKDAGNNSLLLEDKEKGLLEFIMKKITEKGQAKKPTINKKDEDQNKEENENKEDKTEKVEAEKDIIKSEMIGKKRKIESS